MIRGFVKGRMKGAVERFRHRAKVQKDMKGQRLAFAIRAAVEAELRQELGDKFDRHFSVSVIPSAADGYNVKVRADTDIAFYLYYGTKAHPIVATDKIMPIYPERGIFAWRVNHPGQDPLKLDMDNAVDRAVYRALAVVD